MEKAKEKEIDNLRLLFINLGGSAVLFFIPFSIYLLVPAYKNFIADRTAEPSVTSTQSQTVTDRLKSINRSVTVFNSPESDRRAVSTTIPNEILISAGDPVNGYYPIILDNQKVWIHQKSVIVDP